MSSMPRENIYDRMSIDLVGPASESEQLTDRPNDAYLTGILYPQQAPISEEDNDSLASEGAGEEQAAANDEAPLDKTMRPASAGVSFAVASEKRPAIKITVTAGTYALSDEADKGRSWKRTPRVSTVEVELDSDRSNVPSEGLKIDGLGLYLQTSPWQQGLLVTVAVVNTNKSRKKDSRDETARKCFYQVKLRVQSCAGTTLVARPSRTSGDDPDARAARLLYRDAREFATGHTCSANWAEPKGDKTDWVESTWLPRHVVRSVSTRGHKHLEILKTTKSSQPLQASWLAAASSGELNAALSLLTTAYRQWIAEVGETALPEEFREQASRHVADCRTAADRIDEAITLINSDSVVRRAFQLANKAMSVQRGWADSTTLGLEWRPFQLAFFLLAIPSVYRHDHPHRGVMDLLWFPTGGGKTEAYLGLLAFTLFVRRLRNGKAPERGAGVAAIMRYTLRLLTTQQFERAAALILACELIRLDEKSLGPSFSLGLWVGNESVPNDFDTAAKNLVSGDRTKPSAAQLTFCPCCGKKLVWTADHQKRAVHVTCNNAQCDLRSISPLPIWTVDEDVYREAPSLLIGTVDKFAQIVRKPESGVFFGLGTNFDAPDLIIQDELHLISGPLGTMAGLYETAIDRLCAGKGRRPKIIGSTATIRRAEPQIRALFGRETAQFPPPGITASDSCFAIVDTEAPGRLYVGVTTAGRSAKFTLQAVCASGLQSAASIPASERDPYWTFVAYFNSLRELGGAVVLMQDDVGMTVEQFAARRNEGARKASEVRELTSRVTQLEVHDILDILKVPFGKPGAVDVLLASNMISVGVDIPRLGIMVVNGQPKGISEYIQATSRVGRGAVPGFIVTVYNSGKTRDRSHFETFRMWHETLYREVDATSVTPFASRARDRALHAALVAMIRHLVPQVRDNPSLANVPDSQLEEFIDLLVSRADLASNGEESSGTREDLELLQEKWNGRPGLQYYWWDYKLSQSLLVSAERAAELRACGRGPGEAWPTPNSMRNVEPGTPFTMVERLASAEELEAKRKAASNVK